MSKATRRSDAEQPRPVGQMGQPRKQPRPRSIAAERDAAYRKALGLDPDSRERLPSAIGTQASAGGSRGGRGARQKGKGTRS